MVKVLALTLGDRYGIGPELVARLTAAWPGDSDVRLAVIGDRRVFAAGRRTVGLPEDGFTVARSFAEVRDGTGGWAFLDRPFDAEVLPLGRMSPEAGREVLTILAELVDAMGDGAIDGLVYAPLNKQAMKAAGHLAGDELEFFIERLPAAGPVGEINVLDNVWTSRVTSHVPLRQVGELITVERVTRGIELLWACSDRPDMQARDLPWPRSTRMRETAAHSAGKRSTFWNRPSLRRGRGRCWSTARSPPIRCFRGRSPATMTALSPCSTTRARSPSR